jgi:hypothetical protein
LSARDDVMKMISKKQKKSTAFKKKEAIKIGTYGLVMRFIEAMERVSASSKNALDYNDGLQRETRALVTSFQQLDPEVQLEISWSNHDDSENWKDLTAEGVTIKWSQKYADENPTEGRELYIDVGTLLLGGYLD